MTRHGQTQKGGRVTKRTAYLTERRLQSFLFSFVFFKHCSTGSIKLESSGVYPTSFLFSFFFSKHCCIGGIKFGSSGVYSISCLFLLLIQKRRPLHKLLHKSLTVALSRLDELELLVSCV